MAEADNWGNVWRNVAANITWGDITRATNPFWQSQAMTAMTTTPRPFDVPIKYGWRLHAHPHPALVMEEGF